MRSNLLRFHAEEDHVAIQVGNVEVAQAIVVVLRRLEDLRATLHQLGLERVDIIDGDRDGAVRAAAQDWCLWFEDKLRANPENWLFWLDKRWSRFLRAGSDASRAA